MHFKIFFENNPHENTLKLYFYLDHHDLFSDKNQYLRFSTEVAQYEIAHVIESKVSNAEFPHKYKFGRGIFKYPLFNRKLETLTEWVRGEEDESIVTVAKTVLNILCQKMLSDFEEELEESSYVTYKKYKEDHYTVISKALCEGEIVLYLKSSDNMELEENEFKGDFSEYPVRTIRQKKSWRIWLKEDEKIRQDRDARIETIRETLECDGC